MQGDRKNYGKGADAKRFTVRLYGELRSGVERLAEQRGTTCVDVIIQLTDEGLRRRQPKF